MGHEERHRGRPLACLMHEVERLAYLLNRLDSVVDGEDGSTLLDNTLVYFSSEIEDGNSHRHTNMPILTAGGGLDLKRPYGSQVSAFGDNRVGLSFNQDRMTTEVRYRSVYLPFLQCRDNVDPAHFLGTQTSTATDPLEFPPFWWTEHDPLCHKQDLSINLKFYP